MSQNPNSAIARDLEEIKAEPPGMSELIALAAKESGTNPFRIGLDYRKVKKGPGRLRFEEYYQYGLYDSTKFSDDERMRFLSAYIHWPVFDEVMTRDWWMITEDKWISGTFLEAAGLPVPQTLAVIDKTHRQFPGTTKIASSDELASFLKGAAFPIFAKAQDSMWSAGSFVIEGVDGDSVHVRNEAPMSLAAFMDEYASGSAYILQKMLTPHTFFDGVTDATATMRIVNLVNEDGVFNPFAVLKLPMGGNIADNFWRSGNVLCEIDLASGELKSLVTKQDNKLVRHDSLPNSDRGLLGEVLPFWDEVKTLNETVALMHGGVSFGSTDIAITDAGPVVVEVNCGSAFELPQMATGKGFLTDEVRAWFKGMGSKLLA